MGEWCSGKVGRATDKDHLSKFIHGKPQLHLQSMSSSLSVSSALRLKRLLSDRLSFRGTEKEIICSANEAPNWLQNPLREQF